MSSIIAATSRATWKGLRGFKLSGTARSLLPLRYFHDSRGKQVLLRGSRLLLFILLWVAALLRSPGRRAYKEQEGQVCINAAPLLLCATFYF